MSIPNHLQFTDTDGDTSTIKISTTAGGGNMS